MSIAESTVTQSPWPVGPTEGTAVVRCCQIAEISGSAAGFASCGRFDFEQGLVDFLVHSLALRSQEFHDVSPFGARNIRLPPGISEKVDSVDSFSI